MSKDKVYLTVIVLLAIALIAGCARPKPNLEILDYSMTVTDRYQWDPYFSYHVYTPYCSGRVTNTGDKTAYKVKVYVEFNRDDGGGRNPFNNYITNVNLEPAEVSSFSVKGDSAMTSYHHPNPYTFSVDTIWAIYE